LVSVLKQSFSDLAFVFWGQAKTAPVPVRLAMWCEKSQALCHSSDAWIPPSPGCHVVPSATNHGCGPRYEVEVVAVGRATVVHIRVAKMHSTGTPVLKSS